MKKPYEMPFAEFADLAKARGACNRLPQEGTNDVLVTYSVYMNGPVVDVLPPEALEHEFQEGRLVAVTAKLGLNTESFRDKLKVAELVATRSAWMSSVLDASMRRNESTSPITLLPEVLADYSALTEGFDHPWIADEIATQLNLDATLPQVLKAAEEAMGRSLADQIPEEISHGPIVAQNNDFTVQATGNGVVSHENRRLASMPAVGENVTVVYYKGNGQVFVNGQELKVSAPFIDEKTGDLGIQLLDDHKTAKQVVLFNGVATFAKFVEQQGLNRDLVNQALDVRTATPKRVPDKIPEGAKLVTTGRYIGRVAEVTPSHVVQGAAPGQFVAHPLKDFSRVPAVGEKLDVQYKAGKATVVEPIEKARSNQR